jgi:hypothetical protein
MNLGTIQMDFLTVKDITNSEFVNRLYDLGYDGGYRTLIDKETIKCHLEDLKSDGERHEEYRIKNEPWQTYLQSIFDKMKTDYLFIKY